MQRTSEIRKAQKKKRDRPWTETVTQLKLTKLIWKSSFVLVWSAGASPDIPLTSTF